MKRSLVILRPVQDGSFPDWFYQPFPVSDVPSGVTTHFASLLVGSVPPHGGQTLKIGPTDTLKSVLSRAGFSRVLRKSPHPVDEKIAPQSASSPTSVAPPSESPGLFSRVKKWFSRK